MDELSRETGLSPYLLSVFYDFYEHRLLPVKERTNKGRERLVAIFNDNPDITPIRRKPSENEIRQIVREYEKSLSSELTHQARDEAMVRKFLSWAQTHSGHFIMVHYHGEGGDWNEMKSVSNWSPLHKKYLVFFHKRFTKDRTLSLPLGMSSLDVGESGDGRKNLSIDVRFVVNKWFDSATERQKELLLEGIKNFPRKPLYLIKSQHPPPRKIMSQQQQQQQQHVQSISVSSLIAPILEKLSTSTTTSSSGKRPNSTMNHMVVEEEEEEEEEEEDDPYEVKEEKYRRVTKNEYSNKLPIHKDSHCSLHDWLEASRASFLSKKHQHPLEYYTFDPIRLFDACSIALHMEGQLKRVCTQIPLKHLQVVQNNDMLPILNFFSENKTAKEDLNRYYTEYIYSLFLMENTTRHLPPTISDSLNDVFEELASSL